MQILEFIFWLNIWNVNSLKNLTTLAQFVINVYVLIGFEIKSRSFCKHGTLNLCMVLKSRTFNSKIKSIIVPGIQKNDFFPLRKLVSIYVDRRSTTRQGTCYEPNNLYQKQFEKISKWNSNTQLNATNPQ